MFEVMFEVMFEALFKTLFEAMFEVMFEVMVEIGCAVTFKATFKVGFETAFYPPWSSLLKSAQSIPSNIACCPEFRLAAPESPRTPLWPYLPPSAKMMPAAC